MNKAKALFAAGIIVVVAAASASLYYLNESGKIGKEPQSDADSPAYEEYDDSYDNKNPQSEDKTTQAQTTTENNDENSQSVEKDEINEFLSVFSNVYFAEQKGSFDADGCTDYELVLFAYLHIRNTDKASVVSEKRDDSIVYYSGVPFDKVNDVLDKYFGLSVSAESVYNENDYEFFRYENGYFYTPSADGLGYTNTCVADSVAYSGDNIIVQFTVYASEDKYATGEARIKLTDNGMKLDLYRISF